MNKYFNDALLKLKNTYHMDVLTDVFSAMHDRVILFADRSDPKNIILEVLSGNLEIIGFDDHNSIKLSEIFDVFEYDNKYGEIAGKLEYFQGIYQQINDFSEPKDISFPIMNKGVRKWLRFNIFPSPKNPKIVVFTIMDVTRLHTQEEETFGKTHIDSLTKLFNKYTFDYHYGLMYALPGFHVMYIDLDNFKDINDKKGHVIGNEFLKAVGGLLKKYESADKHFYRIGGDEFIGLLIGSTQEIQKLSAEIVEGCRKLKITDVDVPLTLSMGVMKASKSVDLARKADDLMYQVKNMGKNNFLYAIEKE